MLQLYKPVKYKSVVLDGDYINNICNETNRDIIKRINNSVASRRTKNCFRDKGRRFKNMNCQYYGLYMVNKIRKIYEEQNNIKYDYIIRYRFDMQPYDKINFNLLDCFDNSLLVNHCRDNHNIMNDQICVGTRNSIDKYMDIYNNIGEILLQIEKDIDFDISFYEETLMFYYNVIINKITLKLNKFPTRL